MKLYNVFIWNETDKAWHLQNANRPLAHGLAKSLMKQFKEAGYKTKIKEFK